MTFAAERVAVGGGELSVGVAGDVGGADPVVLYLHGITGNHLHGAEIAKALPGFTVVAPDLRGRGQSAGVPGPYSMKVHAADCTAALDALAPGRGAILVGHSMGGFVALTLAAAHPERVVGVVLVDGGPALPMPEGLDIDQVLQAVIGPAMERLSMRFESKEAYVDWWRPHPALADPDVWERILPAILYDAVEGDDGWRSSVSIDAVRGDATSQLGADSPPLEVEPPTVFLRAERGMLDQEGGLYPEEMVMAIADAAGVAARTVPSCNHYSIGFGPHAVAEIASTVEQLASGR